jgi:hypothetical protein
LVKNFMSSLQFTYVSSQYKKPTTVKLTLMTIPTEFW